MQITMKKDGWYTQFNVFISLLMSEGTLFGTSRLMRAMIIWYDRIKGFLWIFKSEATSTSDGDFMRDG